MTLIARNNTVAYNSTCTKIRVFTGIVRAVYGDQAVVQHKSEPHFVRVPCSRLRVVSDTPQTHKGYFA